MDCCCCASLRTKNVVFLGGHRAGTTTLVQHLVHKRPVGVVPSVRTERWAVEEHLSGAHFTAWDVACAPPASPEAASIAKLLKRAFGLVFVVDCSKPTVDPEERALFVWAAACVRSTAAIFVVANKQDAEGALSPAQVATQLGLQSVADDGERGGCWTCQPCVATSAALRPSRILDFFTTGDPVSMFSLDDVIPRGSPAIPSEREKAAGVIDSGRGACLGGSAMVVDDAQPMLATRQPNLLHRVGQLPKAGTAQGRAYVPLDSE